MVVEPHLLEQLIAAFVAGLSALAGSMAFFSGLVAAMGLVLRNDDATLVRQINHALGVGFILGAPAGLLATMILLIL